MFGKRPPFVTVATVQKAMCATGGTLVAFGFSAYRSVGDRAQLDFVSVSSGAVTWGALFEFSFEQKRK